MDLLETQLDEQKLESHQSIERAKRDVQDVQRQVLEDQDALKAKQAEVIRAQAEESEMTQKATHEEKLEILKERTLARKGQEASDMEEKGKIVLDTKAKARVAQLRKMISQEEALEMEQVAALKKQIAEANRSELADVKSRSFLQKS